MEAFRPPHASYNKCGSQRLDFGIIPWAMEWADAQALKVAD